MAKGKYTKGVTPIGEALYAHLLKTEVIRDNEKNTEKDTGKFTVQLKFKEKDEQAFVSKVQAEWDKWQEELKANNKKLAGEPSLGSREVDEQNYFKFTMNEAIKLKDGTTMHRTVPLFDSKGTKINDQITSIGNGSRLKVAYELVPFYMSKTTYGISLRLTAVQVLELKEYTQDAASFGFEAEEGYTVDTTDEDVPTVNSSEDDDDEGDF